MGISLIFLTPLSIGLAIGSFIIAIVIGTAIGALVGPFIIFFDINWSWLCFPCLYPLLLIISAVGSIQFMIGAGFLVLIFFIISYVKTIWTIFTIQEEIQNELPQLIDRLEDPIN